MEGSEIVKAEVGVIERWIGLCIEVRTEHFERGRAVGAKAKRYDDIVLRLDGEPEIAMSWEEFKRRIKA